MSLAARRSLWRMERYRGAAVAVVDEPVEAAAGAAAFQRAYSSAPVARSLRSDAEACQIAMRRLWASPALAAYTNPDQVRT